MAREGGPRPSAAHDVGDALGLRRLARLPHRLLLVAGTLLIVACVVVVVAAWRSPDLDVRCDESKKAERADQGRDYSCVLPIPEHPRPGH
jgi:hypothetical protein